ncbi:hypothetical protein [Sphingomonas sp. MS122]|uniref:hypothetical protein n=1 Tax=Sphingomonas sp. MS122 TaxID=3412683 RepID=UPI003C2B27E2
MQKALPLVAIALSGCAATAASPPEGPARLGQTVYVDGPRATPLKVIEDSRCPMNARCIWAGRVVLRTTVRGGAWKRTLDLTLGEPVQVADGKLTLTSVTPDRRTDRQIAPRDYRFTFVFQGGL